MTKDQKLYGLVSLGTIFFSIGVYGRMGIFDALSFIGFVCFAMSIITLMRD